MANIIISCHIYNLITFIQFFFFFFFVENLFKLNIQLKAYTSVRSTCLQLIFSYLYTYPKGTNTSFSFCINSLTSNLYSVFSLPSFIKSSINWASPSTLDCQREQLNQHNCNGHCWEASDGGWYWWWRTQHICFGLDPEAVLHSLCFKPYFQACHRPSQTISFCL